MFDYSKLPRHNVLCIDMKSFYASCEAVRLGYDPLKICLAVVGDIQRSGSIVLAASPMMKKKWRIKTGSRLFEIPKHHEIHMVEANMGYYLKKSMEITKILNEFAPVEAIHVYSVDESWICIDGTEKLFGDRWEVANKIRNKIYNNLGLPSCIGIGPNKFLSKAILDVIGKKKGIAECQYEDVPELLWPVPIEDIWGIGSRMKRNLNRMGIFRLEQLAKYPLEPLKRRFGVMGEQMYYHAWGIDLSPVFINPEDVQPQKGYGHGGTLLRDYTKKEVKIAILELCEEVARRARTANMAGRTIHFGVGYSKEQGGGFHRSRTMSVPTNITMELYNVCLELLDENFKGEWVRRVHVSLTNLVPDDGIQLNFFDKKDKKRELGYTMDSIRAKFGAASLLRAVSYTKGGIMIDRTKKIGGHKA